MKTITIIILLLSLAFAQNLTSCVNDGICKKGERDLGCIDCRTGPAVPRIFSCIDDNNCTIDERDLGTCNDCKPSPFTGLGVYGSTIFIVSIFGIIIILALIGIVLLLNAYKTRKIKL